MVRALLSGSLRRERKEMSEAMTRVASFSKLGWESVVAALIAVIASGCGFSSPQVSQCGPTNSPNWIQCMLDTAPFRDSDSNARKVVYEAPGLIRVLHGESCVNAPQAAQSEAVGFRIRDTASVPFSIADSGTVFMNGWHLRYKNGDHHLQALGSALVNVTTSRTADEFVLNWEAGGVVTDDNGDDPYQWCYTYTAVFWSRRGTAFDAVMSHTGLGVLHQTAADPGNDGAVRFLSGSTNNPYGPGVVLPQGFAMLFSGPDHHLLQVGLDYGQHYTLPGGFIAWDSRTLLKDNDKQRDYYAGELVATLSYSSPQSWHPESVQRKSVYGWESQPNAVGLLPYGSTSFCSGLGDSSRVEEYKIEGVPFEYAVPVLKGWELGYVCTDHHVRELGASIVDWHYERGADAKAGTLYYTLSTKLGDDGDNVSYGRASIDVFGMNARGIGRHPLNVPSMEKAVVVEASAD
jgi:hypothetical protein